MSKWWEDVENKEELIGMEEYVEKKLEVAKENGGVDKEDMKEHFEEEQVEKFEANFPWKEISFDEYLLLMGEDVELYHRIGKDLINGNEVINQDKENWYDIVKDYNKKTINQYKDIDARKMFKWLKRNKDFEKYDKKYNKLKDDDKKMADVNVYNQMLKDYIIEGIIPPFDDVMTGNMFFDPSSMKVVKENEITKK